MGFLECLLGEDRKCRWQMFSEGIMEQNEPLPDRPQQMTSVSLGFKGGHW